MPNEAPERFLDKFDPETVPFQPVYAMSSIVDEALRNVTGALQVKGMWQNTLMVVASDNVRANQFICSPQLTAVISIRSVGYT